MEKSAKYSLMLTRIDNYINNVDSKASIVLAFIAIVAGIISAIFLPEFITLNAIIDWESLGSTFLNICIILFILSFGYFLIRSIYFLILVISPKQNPDDFNSPGLELNSMFFYKTIVKRETYKDLINKEEAQGNNSTLDDILSQIYICARICNRKFKNFEKALKALKITLFIVAGLTLLILIKPFIHKIVDVKDEIKIGVILPLTGPGSAYGEMVQDGILLAMQQIENDSSFTNKNISLIFEDSETKTTKSLNAFNKLINSDGVKFILGPLTSPNTLACAQHAEKHKIILLTPGSSADEISFAGDYIFRIAPNDSYDGKFLATAIKNKFNIDSMSILTLNNSFGKGLATKFSDEFEKLNGKIIITQFFELGTRDVRTQILKFKERNVKNLLLIAGSEDNAFILRQMKELGFTPQVFAPSSFNSPDIPALAGGAAEGVIFSAASFDGIKDQKEVKKFLESFSKTYPNKTPTTFTAYGYDALKILVKLIDENSYNSDKVKNALYKMPPFYGASGSTQFDNNGDAIKVLSLFKVIKGEFIVIN